MDPTTGIPFRVFYKHHEDYQEVPLLVEGQRHYGTQFDDYAPHPKLKVGLDLKLGRNLQDIEAVIQALIHESQTVFNSAHIQVEDLGSLVEQLIRIQPKDSVETDIIDQIGRKILAALSYEVTCRLYRINVTGVLMGYYVNEKITREGFVLIQRAAQIYDTCSQKMVQLNKDKYESYRERLKEWEAQFRYLSEIETVR